MQVPVVVIGAGASGIGAAVKLRQAGIRVPAASHVPDAQHVLRRTVHNVGGCSSHDLDVNGRNSFSWPWSTVTLRKRIKDFDAASCLATVAAP